jgi:hypothetical protein
MLCECIQRSNSLRAIRFLRRRLQMEFEFPSEVAAIPLKKRTGPSITELERQPSNFPPGWMQLSSANPSGWREVYYASWVASRKAAGLPHFIKNPLPSWAHPAGKKPCASARVDGANQITSRGEGNSSGNAVPGQLCDPRRMTAFPAGDTSARERKVS